MASNYEVNIKLNTRTVNKQLNNLEKRISKLNKLAQGGRANKTVLRNEQEKIKKAGCQFVVFDTYDVPGHVLLEEDISKGMLIDDIESDSRTRAIEDTTLDFLILTSYCKKLHFHVKISNQHYYFELSVHQFELSAHQDLLSVCLDLPLI